VCINFLNYLPHYARDDNAAHKISAMRFHGIDRAAWNRFSKSGNQHYDVIEPGYKFNMMDLQAALGIHQLPRLDDFITKRTKLVERYYEILKDWPQFTLPTLPNYPFKHAWHLFAPLVNPEAASMDRDAFMQAMKEHNIGTGLHYQAAHLFNYYRENFGYKPGDFPVAEDIGHRIVSLPLFPDMTLEEQDRVFEAMKKIFKRKN